MDGNTSCFGLSLSFRRPFRGLTDWLTVVLGRWVRAGELTLGQGTGGRSVVRGRVNAIAGQATSERWVY